MEVKAVNLEEIREGLLSSISRLDDVIEEVLHIHRDLLMFLLVLRGCHEKACDNMRDYIEGSVNISQKALDMLSILRFNIIDTYESGRNE